MSVNLWNRHAIVYLPDRLGVGFGILGVLFSAQGNSGEGILLSLVVGSLCGAKEFLNRRQCQLFLEPETLIVKKPGQSSAVIIPWTQLRWIEHRAPSWWRRWLPGFRWHHLTIHSSGEPLTLRYLLEGQQIATRLRQRIIPHGTL